MLRSKKRATLLMPEASSPVPDPLSFKLVKVTGSAPLFWAWISNTGTWAAPGTRSEDGTVPLNSTTVSGVTVGVRVEVRVGVAVNPWIVATALFCVEPLKLITPFALEPVKSVEGLKLVSYVPAGAELEKL